jgi:hypothetical protein
VLGVEPGEAEGVVVLCDVRDYVRGGRVGGEEGWGREGSEVGPSVGVVVSNKEGVRDWGKDSYFASFPF